MGDAIRVSGQINAAGLEMSIETGKLANLAAGAVVVTVGDTVVLSTVATSKPREGIDFFPLTVDVEERMYAAGKIPGSFFRREGRPGEEAILTCRLTDRPLRPSFPSDFRNEVQVIATILGSDQANPHDIISINGASAALMISGIPFDGPIGAVRLAHLDGAWVAHPTYQEGDESTFELVVAGRRTDAGEIAIMMVEAGGTEAAWELYEQGAPKVTEETIAEGLEVAKEWIGVSIDMQLELREAVIAAKGPIRDDRLHAERRLHRRRLRGRGRRGPHLHVGGDGHRRQERAQRPPRRDQGRAAREPRRHRRRAGHLRRSRQGSERRVPLAAEAGRARPHRQRRRAHRRSWRHRHPAALGRGRHHQHGARLRSVPAGRDPGPVGDHARHAPHGADRRHARPRRPQALHAPLQLPAVLHG